MKKRLLCSPILLIATALASCSGNDDSNSTENPNPDPNPVYELGGTGPGGGIIFYMISEGHGYEMGSSLGTAKWQDIENLGAATSITGLGTAIGTGRSNTELIVTTLGNGNYAAKLCSDYSHGGMDDWFLPSRDEVKEMYYFSRNCGCVSIEPLNNYWSSSQGSNAGVLGIPILWSTPTRPNWITGLSSCRRIRKYLLNP